MKKLFLFSIIIIISINLIGCFDTSLKTESDIFNAIKKYQNNTIKNSLVIKDLPNNKKLVVTEDEENIYAYYLDRNQLSFGYVVYKYTTTNSPLNWGYTTSPPPDEKKPLLLGVYDDKVINKITVNGIQEKDIYIIPREKEDVFYVFDREIPIPVDIKGYSSTGELIYSPVPSGNTKHNKW